MIARDRTETAETTPNHPNPDWAWAAYQPNAKRPWTAAWAGHLYRRAAFGATIEMLETALREGPQATVDRLVHPSPDAAQFEAAMDRDEDAVARSGSAENARAWWLRRLLETPAPLREKMTLFWHSHFGVSNARVQDIGLMVQYVRMLRTHALGAYRKLLEAAARDPAVLLGVGAGANRRARPNESFARQLLDQFGVGPGNYGEEDVREAARAFTGWFVLRGRARFLAREHDTGEKRVLGRRGPWKAEDVVDMVLDQPATPRMLVRKLYRWLISETHSPAPALLEQLVKQMGTDHDIGRVVEIMLRSNLFFSSVAYRKRVKSPVDFAIGMVRAMGADVPTVPLGADLARLGQDLYRPPTMAGWIGGSHWLNAATMIERANLGAALWRPKGAYGGKLNPLQVAEESGKRDPAHAAQQLVYLFVQGDVSRDVLRKLSDGKPTGTSASEIDRWMRQVACRIVALPEFQLA